MKRKELIDFVAQYSNKTRAEAEQMLSDVFGAFTELIAYGNEVKILHFGTFYTIPTKDRILKISNTPGGTTFCPAGRIVKFRASNTLKDAVKKVGDEND